jgi:hypothetical protein
LENYKTQGSQSQTQGGGTPTAIKEGCRTAGLSKRVCLCIAKVTWTNAKEWNLEGYNRDPFQIGEVGIGSLREMGARHSINL